jgi:CheY-like chemotaxis protein
MRLPEDANEALEIFASGEPVDVVFTDVQMPGAMDELMLVHGLMSIIRHPSISHLRKG